SDPGDWNEALMDLGREVCRVVPRCGRCPLARWCRFRRAGSAPVRGARRQAPYAGSFRQVRGSVVRTLRSTRSATLGGLARDLGEPLDRITEAVRALDADGVV